MAERGWVPTSVVRLGIRQLLTRRLRDEARRHGDRDARLAEWVRHMAAGPVAPVPEAANRQHYEVPPAFFERVLGPHLKYSSAYFETGDEGLGAAEAAMLALTAERAHLQDGQRVLELGCGWGSLTLWMAERFPRSEIVAVSNSAPQRAFIEARAAARGLSNLCVITADMNRFEAPGRFDRVVSVEMFEHMRNWAELLGRVRGWLRDDGLVFLHVFAHRAFACPFETTAEDDWMGRHFFTGGMMPSVDLLERLETPLRVVERTVVNGRHYARTAERWRENLDAHREALLAILAQDLGPGEAARALGRWRIFFLACAELFGFAAGTEWMVVHALLAPTPTPAEGVGDTEVRR